MAYIELFDRFDHNLTSDLTADLTSDLTADLTSDFDRGASTHAKAGGRRTSGVTRTGAILKYMAL